MRRSAHGSTPLCQHPAELYATDTHCHLERFRSPPDVLARAGAAGVRVVAVTSRPSDFRMLFPLYGRRKGVRLALGLHPLEVEKVDLDRELGLFSRYVAHTSYIGEIGLDLSRAGLPSRDIQESAFDALLQMPGVQGKVLSVHSRAAAAEVVRRLMDARARRVILHWYSGSLRDLEVAVGAGFYFSINPTMTRNAKGQAIISALPHDRVLAETDGPYARVGSRELEPTDVILVLNYLAKHWRVSSEDVAARLAANLARLCDGIELHQRP